MMTSHDLARELLSMPSKPVVISVDISTCDADAGKRVFTDDYMGINDSEADEIVLLFTGALNCYGR